MNGFVKNKVVEREKEKKRRKREREDCLSG